MQVTKFKFPLTLGFMPGTGMVKPFDEIFEKSQNILEKGTEGVDAVVVWGGTDIHPSYYGQEAHRYNEVRGLALPTQRDANEWAVMKWAKVNNKPIIGVCRGAQMACAFAGGRLIQDVNNHGTIHRMSCADNIVREANSYHHQMMYPYEVDHQLLAWTTGRATTYEDHGGSCHHDMQANGFKEPEIVYFPTINALAIQYHPEWMDVGSPGVQYALALVREKLLNKQPVVVEMESPAF